MKNSTPGSLVRHAKDVVPEVLWAAVSVAGVLALAGLAKIFLGIPFGSLTNDPAATMHMPFYIGCISNLGLLLWAATAAVCFLGYASIRTRIADSRILRFLLASGLLSTLLCFDDMLQIHDHIFPKILHISERTYYAGFLVLVLAYLFHFRPVILRNNHILLILALALFAASRVFDLLFFENIRFGIVLEAATKLLGIVMWLMYYWRISLTAIDLKLEGAP